MLFAPRLVYFIQTEINFLCPCAPLEFTQNKLLVPPQNLFMPPPPSHAILGPGLKPHLLKKLLEWFQAVTNMLSSFKHAHPGAYLGGDCAMPPLLGHGTKQKSIKYKLQSRNQIIIKHACGRGLRYLAFEHHFNQLESRSGADFRFFGSLHAKILPL